MLINIYKSYNDFILYKFLKDKKSFHYCKTIKRKFSYRNSNNRFIQNRDRYFKSVKETHVW